MCVCAFLYMYTLTAYVNETRYNCYFVYGDGRPPIHHVNPTYYFRPADVYTHSQRFSTTRQRVRGFLPFPIVLCNRLISGKHTNEFPSISDERMLTLSMATAWNLYFDLQKLYVYRWFTTTGRANDDDTITQTYYRNQDTDGRIKESVVSSRPIRISLMAMVEINGLKFESLPGVAQNPICPISPFRLRFV